MIYVSFRITARDEFIWRYYCDLFMITTQKKRKRKTRKCYKVSTLLIKHRLRPLLKSVYLNKIINIVVMFSVAREDKNMLNRYRRRENCLLVFYALFSRVVIITLYSRRFVFFSLFIIFININSSRLSMFKYKNLNLNSYAWHTICASSICRYNSTKFKTTWNPYVSSPSCNRRDVENSRSVE